MTRSEKCRQRHRPGTNRETQERIMLMTRVLARCTVIFGSAVGLLLAALLGGVELTAWAADTTPTTHQAASLSKKEKQQLVQDGVAQYEAGNRATALKMLEQAVAVFPENYMAPYYLGMIYLDENRVSDAVAQWQRYVDMDPHSDNSMKIRKYLTLLLRREAKAQARLAIAYEDTLGAGTPTGQTVAVTPFRNLGDARFDSLGKGMASMLITDLSQVPALQVIERVKLQVLMDEMALGASGLVDPRSATRMGRLLKASHLTTGSLADLDQEKLQIASVVVDTAQRIKPSAPRRRPDRWRTSSNWRNGSPAASSRTSGRSIANRCPKPSTKPTPRACRP
jgi:TolB-like protein